MTTETMITEDQLAARWGVHPGTLEAWRRNKKGPKFIKLGEGKRAPVRYRLDDIVEYERERTAQTAHTN